MEPNRTQVTEAALAINRREAGHKRMARLALPILGCIMVAAAFLGIGSGDMTGPRIAALTLSALFYILSYSSLICGQWTIGMIPQACIGAYFFSLAALVPAINTLGTEWIRVVLFVLFGLAGIPVLFVIGILIVMLAGSIHTGKRGEYTLLVLGCKLKNGRPGRMLRRRLNKAICELKRHNELVCVVSGGRAPDQPCAEAEAMRNYLIEHSIPSGRIIAETLSSTTYENFLFSRKILSERGLPMRVGVVSDRFHQYRSGRIARTAGINSFPVSCRTVWYLAVQFWMRDALCIIERLIRGHW